MERFYGTAPDPDVVACALRTRPVEAEAQIAHSFRQVAGHIMQRQDRELAIIRGVDSGWRGAAQVGEGINQMPETAIIFFFAPTDCSR